jgi:hypothetical protein
MTNFAVVIISPPGYRHSATFRDVAENINQGLNNLGHNSVIRHAPTPGRQNIVFGSNLLPTYPIEIEPTSILYNLEHIDKETEWVVPKFLARHKQHRTWDFCEWNVRKFADLGVAVRGLLPMAYVEQATKFKMLDDKEYDIVFVGGMTPRRANLLKQLEMTGLKIKWVWQVYGRERDSHIMRSKLALNIHAVPGDKILEIVRLSHLFANKVPVLSERGTNWEEYKDTYENAAVWSDYDDLVSNAVELCKNQEKLNQIGQSGFDIMSNIRIEPYLKELLEKEGL